MEDLPDAGEARPEAADEAPCNAPDAGRLHAAQVVPWTVLQKWYDAGKFKPYDTDQMFELLMTLPDEPPSSFSPLML